MELYQQGFLNIFKYVDISDRRASVASSLKIWAGFTCVLHEKYRLL